MDGEDHIISLQERLTAAMTRIAAAVLPALLTAQLAFQGLVMLQTGGCPPPFLGFDFTLTDTITIRVL